MSVKTIVIHKRQSLLRGKVARFFGLALGAVALVVTANQLVMAAQSQPADRINIWWPTHNAQLSGLQPFKADLSGHAVDAYHMYWSVDSGAWNQMPNDYSIHPHKETVVDVASWRWNGTGPYNVTFTATNTSGGIVAKRTVAVYIGSQAAAPATTVPDQLPVISQPSVTRTAPAVTSLPTVLKANPLAGSSLYALPETPASRQAAEWRQSRPADAALMDRLAAQPGARWFGGWNANVEADTRAYTEAAKAAGSLPVLVAYNIPQRDCGSYSAGGSATAEAYSAWISAFARGIGANPAVVILEPDAVNGFDCLNAADRSQRQRLLAEAVAVLKQQPAARVYVDAGNPRWHGVDEMASRLQTAGISKADGFSLNVSNFIAIEENVEYGNKLSVKLGGSHYVVDTSRNGAGPAANSEWCNPSGRALGRLPSTNTGSNLVDAFLWLKAPGESDGSCNGGPAAGMWWPDYALGLARRAGW